MWKYGSLQYHPNKVLRQFGRVQNIPPPPIPPVTTTARRGSTSTTYTRVRYRFLESMWEQWYNHVIAEGHRSVLLTYSFLSCTDDYMKWYRSRSVVRVQNPSFLPPNFMHGPPHFQPTYDQLYMVIYYLQIFHGINYIVPYVPYIFFSYYGLWVVWMIFWMTQTQQLIKMLMLIPFEKQALKVVAIFVGMTS